MAIEEVGEISKRTDPQSFVVWLNSQLRKDFSLSFAGCNECRFSGLEIDDLNRHLESYTQDELITVSGWLYPPDVKPVKTSSLFRVWLTGTRKGKAIRRVVIQFECLEPSLLDYCQELLKRADNHFADTRKAVQKGSRGNETGQAGGNGGQPVRPDPPPRNASLRKYFEWYHQCLDTGFKITLKDIAKNTGYSESHIKREHGLWQAEHK